MSAAYTARDHAASRGYHLLGAYAVETGIPVAFGVLTDGVLAHAEERAAEAVRSALEMADLFSQLRATAQSGK